MKKYMRFLLILGLLSGITTVEAQPISQYFAKMPDELLPNISVNTRKDLVDFYQNGMAAVMPSAFGGKVTLTELSEDYLLLKTSENADLQLKMLPLGDTTRIIVLIQTVAAPLRVSQARFFSTTWKPLTDFAFPSLTYLDFLDVEKGKVLGLADRFREISIRNFVAYTFEKSGFNMLAHTSIRQDIRPEILNDFAPILRDSLTFVWENGSFKPLNPLK
jgi:hypothetical protein